MSNWKIKTEGSKLKVYKDGEPYCTVESAEEDKGTFARLAKHYAEQYDGFNKYRVLDHYFTTGEKEFEL